MGASYSHSFQPSLHAPQPSVIHRLHQGRVEHSLPPSRGSEQSFLQLRIRPRPLIIQILSCLASGAKTFSQRLWSERYQSQNSFLRKEKIVRFFLNNPLSQEAPVQAQPGGSDKESDLAIGRPPGQAHRGGPHWPGKGDENMMILTMIVIMMMPQQRGSRR